MGWISVPNSFHSDWNSSVDGWVYLWWNGLDFGTQFLLHSVEVEPILISHEIDSQAEVAESARSANAVQVRLRIFGVIKIDDNIDRFDVDATSEQV